MKLLIMYIILCIPGASSGSIDLLPSPSTIKSNSWTEGLPRDDGKEADEMFSFDGKTKAVEVPPTRFNHTLESHFTISTWMKHEQNLDDDSKHGQKEHIVCNADGESKSILIMILKKFNYVNKH